MPNVTELGSQVTALGVIVYYVTQDGVAPPAVDSPNIYGSQAIIMGYHMNSTGRYADTLAVTMATGTISATTTGPAVEFGDRGTLRLTLTISDTPAGSSPTLDVAVQTSQDGSTGWTAVAAFAQQNAAGTTRKVFGPLDRFVRIVETIGGTGGPSFVRTISGEAV